MAVIFYKAVNDILDMLPGLQTYLNTSAAIKLNSTLRHRLAKILYNHTPRGFNLKEVSLYIICWLLLGQDRLLMCAISRLKAGIATPLSKS